MKKTLIALSMLASTLACASDSAAVAPLKHNISTFYRVTNYQEGNVDNDYATAGLSYTYVQPVGFNASINLPFISSSGRRQHSHFMVEGAYRFDMGNNYTLFPIVGLSMDYRGLKPYSAIKCGMVDEKVTVGIGASKLFFDSLELAFSGSIMQDIYKSVHTKVGDKHHVAIETSKKTGVRLVPSLKYSISNRFSAQVTGIYAKSFNGGYTEKGMQLAVSCGI